MGDVTTKPKKKKRKVFLLKTKLRPPQVGTRLLHRPRLYKRLDEAPEGAVVLLCAPAGFGKTTLARTWLDRSQETTHAWLSFDAQDNNFQRFLRYLGAVIKQLAPEFSTELVDAFSPEPSFPVESVLEAMLEALYEVEEPLVLVLDNLHLLENEACHEALSFLLTHWPEHGRVLLCCRSQPPYPLLQWRVQQKLIELGAIQLRMTFKETSRLLRAYLDLGEEEGEEHELDDAFCESVYEKMGGWAAGLQLAMMSLEQADSPEALLGQLEGSQREVEAYLGSEIFRQQPEHIQAFLCRAALLERWTPALCDAAFGRDDSAEIVAWLLEHSLFLQFLEEDEAGRWYAFSPLFHNFLHYEATSRLTKEAKDELYTRASLWYAEESELEEAVKLGMIAENYDTIASLLLSRGMKLVYQIDWDALLHWIASLPAMTREMYPQLRLYESFILCMRGQWGSTAEAAMQRTEWLLDELEAGRGPDGEAAKVSVSTEDLRFMRGQVAYLRAHNARGQEKLAEAIAFAEAALSLIPEEQRSFRSTVRFSYGFYRWHAHGNVQETLAGIAARREQEKTASTGSLRQMFLGAAEADAFLVGGQLHQAARTCRGILESQNSTPASLRRPRHSVTIHIRLGQVLLQWNQLDEAAAHILGAHQHATDRLLWREAERFHIYRILLHLAQGEAAEAADVFVQARKHQPPEQRGPLSLLDVYQARIWLRLGDLEAASHWAQQSGLSEEDVPSFQHETAYLTYIRVLLAQRMPQAALSLATKLKEVAVEGGRLARVLEASLLEALAYAQLEQSDDAWEHLLGALELGQPQDAMRVFVDEGEPVRELLTSLLKAAYRRQQTGPTTYIQKLIAAFPQSEAPVLPEAPSQSEIPVEYYKCDPLSEREIEILSMASTGEPYRSIASRLEISPATVKRHMNNIYSKLGVHNRNDAIAYARRLSLL